MAKRRSRKPKPFFSKSKNCWLARITTNGKRRGRRCQTRSEAEDQLAEWYQDKAEGVNAQGYTVGSFVANWLQRRTSLTQSTVQRYEQWLNHIDDVSEIPLDYLKRKHVVGLCNGIGKIPTRNAVRALLQTILDDAVEQELIRFNPVTSVKRTTHKKRPVEIFTDDEVAAIREAAKEHHYRVALELMLEVGIRPGEAWGLTWKDFARDSLHIQRTVSAIGSELVVKDSPKTASGNRIIPLSSRMLELLGTQRKWAMANGCAAKSLPIFPAVGGNVTWPSNFRQMFKAILSTAGIPNRHLYTCRHTAASSMLNGGVPLPIVAAILGHKSGETTLRIYSHLIGTETEKARRFWDQRNISGGG